MRSGQKQEPSDESKPRKKILDRSPTLPPPSRGDHHGASEATTERQIEAVEAPRNWQEKISGPTAVPRVDGKETEARTSWSTSLHLQGTPGRKSGHEQRPPYESDPEGKIQGTAHGRKRVHTLALSDPETHVDPKALGESHGPAYLKPHKARRGQTGTRKKRLHTGRRGHRNKGQTPRFKGREKPGGGVDRNGNSQKNPNPKRRSRRRHTGQKGPPGSH